MTNIKSSSLGYPRLGEKREWKKALESFWAGTMGEEDFERRMKELRLSFLKKQKEKGLDLIPIGDFSCYDHMLDTAVMFGIVPKRFGKSAGRVPLSTYYAMARGTDKAPACEMTKWFNTNYHYIVPELEQSEPFLTENIPLKFYQEAKKELGIEGKPVIVGPITFVKLSKGYEPEEFSSYVDKLLPLYETILTELEEAGASWVQIDEPILSVSLSDDEWQILKQTYEHLTTAAPHLKILLQTYFGSVDDYQRMISLPVAGIGLDFVYGRSETLHNIHVHGFPSDKVLAAGVIDGRNIWRADFREKLGLLEQLKEIVREENIMVQPSCSLLHVPVTTELEKDIPQVLQDSLAFADEKLMELAVLKNPSAHEDILENSLRSREALAQSSFRCLSRPSDIKEIRDSRPLPFAERQKLQEEKWNLPLLPTTTIGSFPQTREVRVKRRDFRKGDISKQEYVQYIQKRIEEWINIQEDIGLDVFVHGEFERNDMVEFFGEKLKGIAFTSYAWVQSYGSRCVKPPIIYGDVEYIKPMTVEETLYAQSLTDKPVKGMLTGPVTILNWSFVRDDIAEKEVCEQIAVAISNEVKALEEAGIEMIQVDEPALREGMPLKEKEWQEYLDWSVRAFRIATSQVKDTTQIHTHMCYSEFDDIIEDIRALDADVVSIETSRSHGELIKAFETGQYDKGIGLGVYDIHSPRIPSVHEIKDMVERALRVLPPSLFWVNPDCGLKTRKESETTAALKNMVQAAQDVRLSVQQKQV
ncbi:methionine synthase (B12-independent) [Alteribacillus persepolensis]|uniref:5-methyltetrahydropteroyltriglutamate--homocysteine methyltransferase n=1 Tax=Alteribacillus persepolensis TaxID=568899 RepID=A0A1G8B1E4_9BACI|nr:5-methyltetrahydropteroyltriglutamate--homocysteine S-methyltransferase [Alteribacillus persepolensis]SDH26450.1 methionine synthase (B12-independent) [Alteribacillus persepolensis]